MPNDNLTNDNLTKEARRWMEGWDDIFKAAAARAEWEGETLIFFIGKDISQEEGCGRKLLGGDVIKWLPILLDDIWKDTPTFGRPKLLSTLRVVLEDIIFQQEKT